MYFYIYDLLRYLTVSVAQIYRLKGCNCQIVLKSLKGCASEWSLPSARLVVMQFVHPTSTPSHFGPHILNRNSFLNILNIHFFYCRMKSRSFEIKKNDTYKSFIFRFHRRKIRDKTGWAHAFHECQLIAKHFSQSSMPAIQVEWGAVLPRVPEVPCSVLYLEAGCFDGGVSWVSSLRPHKWQCSYYSLK